MSHFLAPARRAFLSSRASPVASTSAYTLNGWVARPLSNTSLRQQPTPTATNSATPVEQAPLGPTTHYRVTLRRSAIGLPSRFSKILTAMKLTKRLQSVYLPQNQAVAGSILAVKELVHVDNVRRLDPPVGRLSEEDAAEELRAWHASVKDEDAVWVDAKGDVIDWGREAKRAPRGYRVVGNLLSKERDDEIRLQNEVGL
jgi:large subunit ribosomal protein L30